MELSYDQLVAAVRAEGVDLHEVNITVNGKNYNSRDMCRCHSGDVNQTYHQVGGNHVRGWAPDGDMTVHITAGDLGSRSKEQYILDILLTNPNAPLAANFAVFPDGTAYILSAGRTNHDLNCSPAAKAAYDNSSWSLDNYQDLRGTGVDPKVFTYGIENVSSTSLDTKPLARATSVKICAAICRAYGRNGRNVAGHGECASDRSYSDPGINMGLFRRDVMARVSNPNIQEDDMFSDNDRSDLEYIKALLAGALDPRPDQPLFNSNGELTKRIRDLAAGLPALTALTQALPSADAIAADVVSKLPQATDADAEALATAVVDRLGTDFANKVIDALGSRINATESTAPSA